MRLLSELKRRKVLQTALIYGAAAWVLLQVAQLLLGMLEVPAWGLKLVFVLLVIGFPLALMLSWMHQITSQGIQRELEPPPSPPRTPALSADAAEPGRIVSAASPAALAATDHSIAVLPFDNMSDDASNAHFADGLSEELLNLLARIPDLRVIARTSSFSFRGRQASAATIARELNVAHLLEGSVRRAGNRIRITAQLIRAVDSSHVWSQTFDRDLSDIFAVQDEIAAAVTRELEIKLLGRSAPTSRQTDPEAYAHYLQGKHFFELASTTGYERAISELEAALAIDPKFGPAWGMLGAVYWGQANNSLIDFPEGARRARANSEKALAMDPDLAEPMSLLGYFDVIDGVDVAGGMRRMERALELEPYNQRILTRAANFAIRRGRLDDALRYGQLAVKSDPLGANPHAIYGNVCYFTGRLEEAEAMRRKVLVLSPGWLSGHFNLGRVLLARHDAAAALAEMEQEQSDFWKYTGLAIAHHALGHAAESDAALCKLMQTDLSGGAYQVVQVHAYRGEIDRAFEWLERALDTHDSALVFIRVDPLLKNLHADPRWATFLTRLGSSG
jgi:TolB-like protein/Flp pilus assembly protein TadD